MRGYITSANYQNNNDIPYICTKLKLNFNFVHNFQELPWVITTYFCVCA